MEAWREVRLQAISSANCLATTGHQCYRTQFKKENFRMLPCIVLAIMKTTRHFYSGLLSLTLLLPASAESVTFSKDIAPMVFQNCTVCHRPNHIGPFPFTNYEEVAKRAAQIVEVTQSRIMPPWKPQPGHGEFQFARHLTEEQIALFEKWYSQGKPFGEARELPPVPEFPEGWQLGVPDIILKLPAPFTIPAEGRDVYVHFPFDLKQDQDIYVVGVEVRPSNLRAAHHGVGMLDDSGTARKLDAATPTQGYERFGGPGFTTKGFTPGYVPGQTVRKFEEGSAITIKKGTDFVLQMHYHPTGKIEQDKVEVGLYLTKTPPTRHVLGILMGSEKVDVPPGEANYVQKDSFKLPVAMKAGNIWAHMHMIGREVKVWAELPNGTVEKLLWINDWDFNWQDTYQFKSPVHLPAGTVVHSEFRWDNSENSPRNPNSPPRRIINGEGSEDEMAGLWLGGELNSGLELVGLLLANLGHYDKLSKEGRAFRKEHGTELPEEKEKK